MLQFLQVAADSITDYGFDVLYWGEPAQAGNGGRDLYNITANLTTLCGALSML
jgi:hypothetical protein